MQPGTKVGLSIIGVTLGLFLVLGITAVVRYNSANAPRPKKSSPPQQQARQEEPESSPPVREQPQTKPSPPPERLRKPVDPESEVDKAIRAIERDAEKQSAELFGLALFIWGWICFSTLAFFVVSVVIIVVLAKDVRARAPDQVPLWCLLFLFGGLFSVIFWLAARPPLREERRFSAGPRDGSDPYF